MKGLFKQPTLIVFCGWPFSGKTSVATAVRDQLDVHHVDIDEVRWLLVGPPYPHPNESPELMKKDGEEMGMAYRLLIRTAHENLAMGRSLILTATFSRRGHQQMLRDLMAKHPEAALQVIWCKPENDTDAEVERRMATRVFGEGGYKGGVNSPEHYREVKERYEPIELPHLKVPTWGSTNSIEACAYLALAYIRAQQE